MPSPLTRPEAEATKKLARITCIQHSQDSSLCQHGWHYHNYGCHPEDGMVLLRNVFPDGKANDLNWLVASTSGVHGTYTTLDEIEQSFDLPDGHDEKCSELTFLMVQPRLVSLTYGTVEVSSREDLAFLRGLIASSLAFIAETQKENV